MAMADRLPDQHSLVDTLVPAVSILCLKVALPRSDKAVVDHPEFPKEVADRVIPMLLLIPGLVLILGLAEVAEATYMEVADAMMDAATDTEAAVAVAKVADTEAADAVAEEKKPLVPYGAHAVAEAVNTEAAEEKKSLASYQGPLESPRQKK